MKTLKRCQTLFLGWDQPLLASCVQHLRSQHGPMAGQSHVWSLDHFLVVLPTRRSGRRLRQLLKSRAVQDGLELVAPEVITVGELPEHLYSRDDDVILADELERTLAWTASLQQAAPETLAPVFPVLPQGEAWSAWIELATTIRRLHEDLASNNLTFADVAAELAKDETLSSEQIRWKILQSLHDQYIESLTAAGRTDPFAARRDAVDQKRCGCSRHLLLIGTSDLSESVTTMLRQIGQNSDDAASGNSSEIAITALVASQEHYRDHFDAFGSIIASRWAQWKLPLVDSQLVPAGDVTDQAAALSQWLESIRADRFEVGANDMAITVGVTNESLVPPIEFEMHQIGRKTYRELGWSFSQTPIGRLVELLATHLSQLSWYSLAALARHADVYQFIERALQEATADSDAAAFTDGGWLVSLDKLLAEHYPTRLDIPLTDRMVQMHAGAVIAAKLIGESLAGFDPPEGFDAQREHRRPLSRWAGEIKSWLAKIYPLDAALLASTTDNTVTEDAAMGVALMDNVFASGVSNQQEAGESPAQRRAKVAIAGCWRSLDRLKLLDPSLDVTVSLGVGIDLVVNRLLDQRVGDLPLPNAIQIAGWLDLALEDSAALAVVGLNHPYVPEAITADPFMPGGLRTRLRMSDNERRLGRDVYALQLILATRKTVRLIVGRTGVDGSPTPPSRLLAAAGSNDVARRLVYLLDDDSIHHRNEKAAVVVRTWDPKHGKTQLPIPTIGNDFDADRDIKAMSVTSFAAYLACPYRFYLRHVLKLIPVDDSSRELAANQFGDLVHNSLEIFGNSAAKDSKDREEIQEAMLAALDEFATGYLGTSPAPAVRLQIEQARQRLCNVAASQAEWRSKGWRIWKVEASVGEANRACIMIDGKPMTIRGRFDRIDQHEDGRWAILDYKTHGHHPREKHIEKTADGFRWIELQLPIYRLMIPYLVGQQVNPKDVTLGYFNVSEKASETKINEADFTDEEYAAADQLITHVVRSIRAGRFEPTADPVMYDDYAMIMQSQIAEQLFDFSEGDFTGDAGVGDEGLSSGLFIATSFGGDH